MSAFECFVCAALWTLAWDRVLQVLGHDPDVLRKAIIAWWFVGGLVFALAGAAKVVLP